LEFLDFSTGPEKENNRHNNENILKPQRGHDPFEFNHCAFVGVPPTIQLALHDFTIS
jgi:hypothetical protein